jgi:hypothetical protein
VAEVGAERARWLARQPTHGRPAREFHATTIIKSTDTSSAPT